MYHIASLSKAAQGELGNILSSGVTRTVVYPVAVAYLLSQQQPLPAEDPKDPSTYYRLNVSLSVKNSLSYLNELAPFDYEAASSLTKAFFLMRLDAAYPTEYPIAFRSGTGVRDFFGLSRALPVEILDVIDKFPAELSSATKSLRVILESYRERNLTAEDKNEIQGVANVA